jgi:hypothetical protein
MGYESFNERLLSSKERRARMCDVCVLRMREKSKTCFTYTRL